MPCFFDGLAVEGCLDWLVVGEDEGETVLAVGVVVGLVVGEIAFIVGIGVGGIDIIFIFHKDTLAIS